MWKGPPPPLAAFADIAAGSSWPKPASASRKVHKVPLPAAAHAVSTLSSIDYHDAFRVDIGGDRRTAEQWARMVLEDAPLRARSAMVTSWTAIGLRLHFFGGSDRFVLGWEIRRRSRDVLLLGASSLIGMPAELVVRRENQTLLFATLVEKRTPLASLVWASIEAMHQSFVPALIERAVDRGEQRAAHRSLH